MALTNYWTSPQKVKHKGKTILASGHYKLKNGKKELIGVEYKTSKNSGWILKGK